jgi:ABC-2 type transport system ATP-binding protein
MDAQYCANVSTASAGRGLRKRYGSVEALKGVDLEVGEGELVGLLGPNGAGKSTLVKIACGLVRPSSGTAFVAGQPAGSPAAHRALGDLAELFRFPDWLSAEELLELHQRLAGSSGGAGERRELLALVGLAEVAGARAGSRSARAALGYLAELFRFPGWYTADEVLELHQRLAGSRGGATERKRLLELVALDDAAKRRVDGMSKGMQQRLGVAQALVGEPRILLLDEPTSALDPVGRRTVRLLLEELRGRGVSVLLNSHLLSEIELVCDRVAILLGGELVAAGTPAELSRPRGVELETDEGLRTVEGALRDDVPRLVAEAVRDGRKVYGVRVLTSTLEDTYLEAVGGETD